MKRIHWSSIASDFVETRINGNPANSENKQMDQSELEERTQETGAKNGKSLARQYKLGVQYACSSP